MLASDWLEQFYLHSSKLLNSNPVMCLQQFHRGGTCVIMNSPGNLPVKRTLLQTRKNHSTFAVTSFWMIRLRCWEQVHVHTYSDAKSSILYIVTLTNMLKNALCFTGERVHMCIYTQSKLENCSSSLYGCDIPTWLAWLVFLTI